MRRGNHELIHQNWIPAPGVRVSFSVKHDGENIYLFYFVEEPHLRAVNKGFNTPVWEDSCVEFFISFEGEEGYYNFEINCIGTLLAAYGPNRQDRQPLAGELLNSIITESSLGSEPIGDIPGPASWDLFIRIPSSTFQYSKATRRGLQGLRGTGNFYKCGDLLPDPHFISWNRVDLPEPDFHRPEFFGTIVFQK